MTKSTVHPVVQKGNHAFSQVILEDVLPALRRVAREDGYALAIHGSLSRDIDLIAVPWVEHAYDADRLANDLVGVLKGFFGYACTNGKPSPKPHGRRAYTIIAHGCPLFFDLSVMPPHENIRR